RLARANVLRDPRRAAATAGALMAGVAVATAMAVTVASAAASSAANADRTLGADFTVGGRRSEAHFGGEVSAAAGRVPGVARVGRERIVPATLTAPGGRVQLKVYGAEPGFTRMTRQVYTAGSAERAVAAGELIMVDEVARNLRAGLGDTVTVQAPGGPARPLRIGAIQRAEPPGTTAGRYRAAPTVSLATLAVLAPDASDSTLYVTLAPGADAARTGAALKSALAGYPQVTVQDRTAYKAFVRHRTDGMLALVYALLAVAIVIALLGVANTLALAVTERTREIGLLRAVGLSRRGLRRTIALESVLLALFGAAEGLLLGAAWGAALPHDTLAVPWLPIIVITVAAVLAGVAAAVVPAARAARLNVLDAIAAS
ncbi:ABC transporter permease, partial [Actinomadura roseirufa]|uniref:ABC transporter permease n=1 Tax=Actinomadura roseirufa TaxID=2094049 RepID=UPI0010414C92